MITSENLDIDTIDFEEKKPVKIVLADDDKDDQELFMQALDAANIRADVSMVDNGQDLINHLENNAETNPDIIFTDLNMPGKGGKEVLAEIKRNEQLKEIPTVVLSTSDNPKEIEDIIANGADLYVMKPISFNGFINIMKKVFDLFWTKLLMNPSKKKFFLSENNLSKD